MRQRWTNRLRLGTMTRGGTILSVVLLAGSGAVAAGNDAPAPGTRVRVTTPDGRVVGRLVELNGESVVLARDRRGGAESLSVDRLEVVGIEVSERRSRKKSWAARGALAGVVAALAVGVAAGESCSGRHRRHLTDPDPPGARCRGGEARRGAAVSRRRGAAADGGPEPGVPDGLAVPVIMTITVDFKLN